MIQVKIWENYHPCKKIVIKTKKYRCQRLLQAYFIKWNRKFKNHWWNQPTSTMQFFEKIIKIWERPKYASVSDPIEKLSKEWRIVSVTQNLGEFLS